MKCIIGIASLAVLIVTSLSVGDAEEILTHRGAELEARLLVWTDGNAELTDSSVFMSTTKGDFVVDTIDCAFQIGMQARQSVTAGASDT